MHKPNANIRVGGILDRAATRLACFVQGIHATLEVPVRCESG